MRTGDGGGRHFYLGHRQHCMCFCTVCITFSSRRICMGFYKLRFTSDIHFYSASQWHCYAAQQGSLGANGLLQPYIEILKWIEL